VTQRKNRKIIQSSQCNNRQIKILRTTPIVWQDGDDSEIEQQRIEIVIAWLQGLIAQFDLSYCACILGACCIRVADSLRLPSFALCCLGNGMDCKSRVDTFSRMRLHHFWADSC
jgi:hypothetical protein